MSDAEIKAALRRQYRGAQASMRTSELIVLQQSSNWSYRLSMSNKQAVSVYVSSGSEVRTHELIAALLGLGKTVSVPRLARTR